MANKQPQPIEIFRPGTFKAMDGRELSYSADDVREIAESYSPAVQASPIVRGHPQHDHPAVGWVAELSTADDGKLRAAPVQVAPEFADEVRRGSFRHVSASIYPREHPANPTPGKLYLKHVGFLGAATPAVTGLKPATFADDSEGVPCFAVEIPSGAGEPNNDGGLVRELLAGMASIFRPRADSETGDNNTHNGRATAPGAGSFSDDNGVTTMTPEERVAALDQREAALKAREAELAAADAQRRNDEAVAFADQLTESGQILPAHRPAIVAALIGASAAAVEFSDGDSTRTVDNPAEGLRKFLADLPKRMELGQSRAGADSAPTAPASSFAAPAETRGQVDEDRLELHRRAMALVAQSGGKLDYDAAVIQAQAAA